VVQRAQPAIQVAQSVKEAAPVLDEIGDAVSVDEPGAADAALLTRHIRRKRGSVVTMQALTSDQEIVVGRDVAEALEILRPGFKPIHVYNRFTLWKPALFDNTRHFFADSNCS
jgi:hypothetical protein